MVAGAVQDASGLVAWAITALIDGVLGLVWGLLLIPVGTRVIGPLIAAVSGKKAAEH